MYAAAQIQNRLACHRINPARSVGPFFFRGAARSNWSRHRFPPISTTGLTALQPAAYCAPSTHLSPEVRPFSPVSLSTPYSACLLCNGERFAQILDVQIPDGLCESGFCSGVHIQRTTGTIGALERCIRGVRTAGGTAGIQRTEEAIDQLNCL